MAKRLIPAGIRPRVAHCLFGSLVMITNPQNGTSVTVVINDHFPFTRGVTLDLSRGTARAIGMHGTSGCACSEKELAFAVGATMGHLS